MTLTREQIEPWCDLWEEFSTHQVLEIREAAKVKVAIADAALHSLDVGQASETKAAIEEALEFIEEYEDVMDGSYGEQRPNRAMQIASRLRRLLGE